MFQDSRLLIMARQDETQVSIDVDGDGNDDITRTLNEGESFTVDGAQAGSEVTSTAPVQVNELTGDVGARFEIYQKLRELTSQGIGIIMISSELPELIGLCDRILVMHQGQITGEVLREDFSEELIMSYAAGIMNQ